MLKKWLPSKREEGTYVTIRDKATSARRRTVILLLLATAVCGWLYLFFGSGMFRITSIETEGLIHLNRGEVSQEAFEAIDEQGTWLWQWRNILLIDTERLARDLETRLFAEHVAVEKSYPSILRLMVEERQSTVIVIMDNDMVLVDRQGVGVRRITNEEEAQVLARLSQPSPTAKTDLPVLTINGTAYFAPGETFVPPAAVGRWLDAFHDLGEAGFGYRNAVLDGATSTKLILNLFEPYDTYMDLLAPVRPQVQSFYAFMNGKPEDTKITEYVDVRVPGKVYYK